MIFSVYLEKYHYILIWEHTASISDKTQFGRKLTQWIIPQLATTFNNLNWLITNVSTRGLHRWYYLVFCESSAPIGTLYGLLFIFYITIAGNRTYGWIANIIVKDNITPCWLQAEMKFSKIQSLNCSENGLLGILTLIYSNICIYIWSSTPSPLRKSTYLC